MKIDDTNQGQHLAGARADFLIATPLEMTFVYADETYMPPSV